MTTHNHQPSRSNSTNQACAACRYQRRKCTPDCLLAPYFPHDRQRQFQNAHKLFGVSNITKIIKHLDRPHKDEAMRSIIYQSDVRAQDPVGGCYRIIHELERQIAMSHAELELVLQQLAVCRNVGVQTQNEARNEECFDFNDDGVDCDPRLYEHHGLNEQNHASVCDDFKLLLIDDVTTLDYKETNQPRAYCLAVPCYGVKCSATNKPRGYGFYSLESEESLYNDENHKDLVKVEQVSYQEYSPEERVVFTDAATFDTLSDCKAT